MVVSKELMTGLLFVFLGGFFALTAVGYPIGTIQEMGSGMFPLVAGILTVIMGAILLLRAMLSPAKCVRMEDFAGLRQLFIIVGSIVAFALLIESAGLIVSLVALIVISRLAAGWPKLLELFCLLAILLAITVGVFVYGLNIPFKIGF